MRESTEVKLLYAAAASFEAACRVANLPEGHRSRRLHGHSFLAKIRVALPAHWASFPGGEVDELRERLESAVAPLDYRLLNELVDQPTDENLARWLRERIDVTGLDTVGVQSTLPRRRGSRWFAECPHLAPVYPGIRAPAAERTTRPPMRPDARAWIPNHPARQPGSGRA